MLKMKVISSGKHVLEEFGWERGGGLEWVVLLSIIFSRETCLQMHIFKIQTGWFHSKPFQLRSEVHTHLKEVYLFSS